MDPNVGVTSHCSNFLIWWWGDTLLSIKSSGKQLLSTNFIFHTLGNIGNQQIKNDSDDEDCMLLEG